MIYKIFNKKLQPAFKNNTTFQILLKWHNTHLWGKHFMSIGRISFPPCSALCWHMHKLYKLINEIWAHNWIHFTPKIWHFQIHHAKKYEKCYHIKQTRFLKLSRMSQTTTARPHTFLILYTDPQLDQQSGVTCVKILHLYRRIAVKKNVAFNQIHGQTAAH